MTNRVTDQSGGLGERPESLPEFIPPQGGFGVSFDTVSVTNGEEPPVQQVHGEDKSGTGSDTEAETTGVTRRKVLGTLVAFAAGSAAGFIAADATNANIVDRRPWGEYSPQTEFFIHGYEDKFEDGPLKVRAEGWRLTVDLSDLAEIFSAGQSAIPEWLQDGASRLVPDGMKADDSINLNIQLVQENLGLSVMPDSVTLTKDGAVNNSMSSFENGSNLPDPLDKSGDHYMQFTYDLEPWHGGSTTAMLLVDITHSRKGAPTHEVSLYRTFLEVYPYVIDGEDDYTQEVFDGSYSELPKKPFISAKAVPQEWVKKEGTRQLILDTFGIYNGGIALLPVREDNSTATKGPEYERWARIDPTDSTAIEMPAHMYSGERGWRFENERELTVFHMYMKMLMNSGQQRMPTLTANKLVTYEKMLRASGYDDFGVFHGEFPFFPPAQGEKVPFEAVFRPLSYEPVEYDEFMIEGEHDSPLSSMENLHACVITLMNLHPKELVANIKALKDKEQAAVAVEVVRSAVEHLDFIASLHRSTGSLGSNAKEVPATYIVPELEYIRNELKIA